MFISPILSYEYKMKVFMVLVGRRSPTQGGCQSALFDVTGFRYGPNPITALWP
jgi:hypothetical protein